MNQPNNSVVLAKVEEINKLNPLEIFNHSSTVSIFKQYYQEKADVWIARERSYLVQLFNDEKNGAALKGCSTFSIQSAIASIVSDGLTLDPDAGEVTILAYKGVAKKTVMYKGLEKILVMAGVLSYFKFNEVIYDNDEFEMDMGEISKYKKAKVKGKSIGAAIRAILPSGQHRDLFLSWDELMKRKDASPSKNFGPWKNWETAMVQKSMVRAICKHLPKVSAKLIAKVEQDEYVQEPEVEQSAEVMEPTTVDMLSGDGPSTVEAFEAESNQETEEEKNPWIEGTLQYTAWETLAKHMVPEPSLGEWKAKIKNLADDKLQAMIDHVKANFESVPF